jgi:hypothetical protein
MTRELGAGFAEGASSILFLFALVGISNAAESFFSSPLASGIRLDSLNQPLNFVLKENEDVQEMSGVEQNKNIDTSRKDVVIYKNLTGNKFFSTGMLFFESGRLSAVLFFREDEPKNINAIRDDLKRTLFGSQRPKSGWEVELNHRRRKYWAPANIWKEGGGWVAFAETPTERIRPDSMSVVQLGIYRDSATCFSSLKARAGLPKGKLNE